MASSKDKSGKALSGARGATEEQLDAMLDAMLENVTWGTWEVTKRQASEHQRSYDMAAMAWENVTHKSIIPHG